MTTERSFTPVELGQQLGRPTADITAMWLAGKFPHAFKSQETGALMIPESDAKPFLDAIPYSVRIARQAKVLVAEEEAKEKPVATVTSPDGEVKDMQVVRATEHEHIFGLDPPKVIPEATPQVTLSKDDKPEEDDSFDAQLESKQLRNEANEYAAKTRKDADDYAKDIRARTDAQIAVLLEQANNEAARITENSQAELRRINEALFQKQEELKKAETAAKQQREDTNALIAKWNTIVKQYNKMLKDADNQRTYYANLARSDYWARFQAWAKKLMA